jgi:hypothetical protein
MIDRMEPIELKEPERHSQAPWGGWQDTLVSTNRMEIDRGMIVQVRLPGLAKAVTVEDAGTSASKVVLADQQGVRVYVGSMDGVVVIAHPEEGKGTGLWSPQEPYCAMTLDD